MNILIANTCGEIQSTTFYQQNQRLVIDFTLNPICPEFAISTMEIYMYNSNIDEFLLKRMEKHILLLGNNTVELITSKIYHFISSIKIRLISSKTSDEFNISKEDVRNEQYGVSFLLKEIDIQPTRFIYFALEKVDVNVISLSSFEINNLEIDGLSCNEIGKLVNVEYYTFNCSIVHLPLSLQLSLRESLERDYYNFSLYYEYIKYQDDSYSIDRFPTHNMYQDTLCLSQFTIIYNKYELILRFRTLMTDQCVMNINQTNIKMTIELINGTTLRLSQQESANGLIKDCQGKMAYTMKYIPQNMYKIIKNQMILNTTVEIEEEQLNWTEKYTFTGDESVFAETTFDFYMLEVNNYKEKIRWLLFSKEEQAVEVEFVVFFSANDQYLNVQLKKTFTVVHGYNSLEFDRTNIYQTVTSDSYYFNLDIRGLSLLLKQYDDLRIVVEPTQYSTFFITNELVIKDTLFIFDYIDTIVLFLVAFLLLIKPQKINRFVTNYNVNKGELIHK